MKILVSLVLIYRLPLRTWREEKSQELMFWLWRISCLNGPWQGFMTLKDPQGHGTIQIQVVKTKFYLIKTLLRRCQLLQFLWETRLSCCWRELFGMILLFSRWVVQTALFSQLSIFLWFLKLHAWIKLRSCIFPFQWITVTITADKLSLINLFNMKLKSVQLFFWTKDQQY